MPETTIEMPALRTQANVTGYDEATNSIEVVWSTGAPVRRWSWRDNGYYDEVLVLTKDAVRMDRLNGGAPLLDTHSRGSLGDVIGAVIEGSAKVSDGKGVARIRLSTADADQDRVQKIKDGTVRNVSVGYLIHHVEKTEAPEGGVATWRITDWEPIEISAVPVPADPGAQFRGGQEPPQDGPRSRCVIVTRQPETSAGAADPTETTMSNQISAEERTLRAERERSAAILKIAEPFGLRELADHHVAAGTPPDQFRAIAMDELAKRFGSDQQITSNNRADVIGPSDAEKRALAIENALLHRADPAAFRLTDAGRDFRGMSLLELARDALEVNGVSARGLSRTEIASRALAPGQTMTRSGGLMATSDFPTILANVLNKSLRRAYEAYGQTFRPLIRQTTVSDFKEVSRVQLGEAPRLEKVNEHGEFKRGSMGEAAEKYAVATYGKIVGITRQVIINDDLDAFTRIPAAFGVQAAQLESDLVWAQIIGNPVLNSDNTALFHADHKNLANTGAAISVDTVGTGRAAIAKQTGIDGRTTLNIVPTSLIVPVVLQTKAEQLLALIYAAKTTDAVPESLRRLGLIAEPRLDNGIPDYGVAGSATAWYLAASTAQVDIVELAYLDGNEGVYTETRVGFEIDGVEVKVRMDVGAKAIDWRGLYKNPGA